MARAAVIGVDPGASGAIALLAENGRVPELVTARTLPTEAVKIGKRTSKVLDGMALALLLPEWELLHDVVIVKGVCEQVASMPRDRAPQAFAFGRSYGAVVAAIQATRTAVDLVPPPVWRQGAGVPRVETGDRKALKAAARKRATELWPEQADLFRRAKDADVAEAALIGLYGFLGTEDSNDAT